MPWAVQKWPNRSRFHLKPHTIDSGPDPHTRRGNFEGKKRPNQEMPGDVWESIYTKWLNIGMMWIVACSLGVADRVHVSTTWRIWLNCTHAVAMWPYVKLLWPLVSIRVGTFFLPCFDTDSWVTGYRRHLANNENPVALITKGSFPENLEEDARRNWMTHIYLEKGAVKQ